MRGLALGFLLASLLLGAACSAGGEDQDRPPPIACFAGEGPLLCRIAGVPVPRDAFARLRDFYRSRHPSWTAYTASLNCLEKILMPRAAAYHAAQDRLPELERRIWEAHRRLSRGEEWRAVCKDLCNNKDLQARGGLLGTFKRQEKLGTLGADFLRRLWTLPVGVVSEPFAEYYGFVVMKVSAEKPSPNPDFTERTVKVIRLDFFPNSLKGGAEIVARARREARVTDIQDPAFKRWVPVVYQKKP